MRANLKLRVKPLTGKLLGFILFMAGLTSVSAGQAIVVVSDKPGVRPPVLDRNNWEATGPALKAAGFQLLEVEEGLEVAALPAMDKMGTDLSLRSVTRQVVRSSFARRSLV